MAIVSRGYRKQFFLFLVAVILPSLVLVAFTLRMISQERELALKRWADERSRAASEIGQFLFVRLEKIKLQEASATADRAQLAAKINHVNPEVVLIGLVDGDQLALPWEVNPKTEECRKLLDKPDFARKIQNAEKEEFVNKNFVRAAALYRQVMEAAQEQVQRDYARLLLARALDKSGSSSESLSQYRRLLALPSGITDDYAIPLSFYAAGRLLDAGKSFGEVAEWIRTELEAGRWLSPAESYMLLELAEKLADDTREKSTQDTSKVCQRLIQEHIQRLEQALALQRDFQGLVLLAKQAGGGEKDEPLWVPYGEGPWLISLSSSLAGKTRLLVAVDVQDILASLKADTGFSKAYPGDIRFLTDNSSKGEFLGPNFRGLKIAYGEGNESAIAKPWSVQPAFYLLALLLVLSVTLFGAYLLWRDVRRDLQMAEMRSQFVSSVSHELKTPLTAIRMFAETLRLGRSKDPETQREYLDTIVNESERLTRLLNNVLDFSKIEQGKRIYRPGPASLSEIIQAAARAMEYPLSQQGFKLNVQTEEELPEIWLDRDALEQAILNLLHNAMKYSGESRDIDLRLHRRENEAVIQVIDRGVGIDPGEKERIFEKFYRVPSEENKRLPGTGLGLALVSHIIKAHGGHIEVEGAPGKGSTFSLYLPLEHKQ
jgi:hypothetical protein